MDFPLHPITGEYDDITGDDLDRMRESLRKDGLIVPIVIWRDQIVDGRHRARLCDEIGESVLYNDISEKTEDEMRAYVRALNEHRRSRTKPLTNAEKRERIETELRANPTLSNRQIAEKVGASHPTVANVRNEGASAGKFTSPDRTTGKDGMDRPAAETIVRRRYEQPVPEKPKEAIYKVQGLILLRGLSRWLAGVRHPDVDEDWQRAVAWAAGEIDTVRRPEVTDSMKEMAARLKRTTRDVDVIALCDAILM
jgi:ParB-like chromosome segregation protein Spo0J